MKSTNQWKAINVQLTLDVVKQQQGQCVHQGVKSGGGKPDGEKSEGMCHDGWEVSWILLRGRDVLTM